MSDTKNDKRGDSWHTIAEAEAILGVSKRTVQRRIKLREIESKLEDGIRYVKLDVSGDKLSDIQSDISPQLLERLEQENQELRQQVEYFREQVSKLQEDLRRKDEQLDEASHRHDTVVMQLTKIVEYQQQPFWRKLFQRKQLPPPVEDNAINFEAGQRTEEKNEPPA